MGHNDRIDFELHDLIQDLEDEGVLARGTPAFGIAQQVIHQGLNSLSETQRAIYELVVIPALRKRGEELRVQQILNSTQD